MKFDPLWLIYAVVYVGGLATGLLLAAIFWT